MLSTIDRIRVAWTVLRSPADVQRPHHLQVVITDRCNLACAGCFKSDPAHRPTNRSIPLERFERILDGLGPRLVTMIGEGDPLLHPQIVELVRATVARGARPLLASNLTVGDATTFRELTDAGLAGIKVTLSHSSRERYREIKGRDLFEDVLQRIAFLQAVPRAPHIELEFWIAIDHLHELIQHLELTRAHGVHAVRFLLHRAVEQRGPLLLDEEQTGHLARASAFARRVGIRTNIESLGRRVRQNDAQRRASCALPWLRAYVNLEGGMGPCVDLVVRSKSDATIVLANALDDAPFSGEVFGALRAAFRRGEPPHAPCVGCTKGRVPGLLCRSRV